MSVLQGILDAEMRFEMLQSFTFMLPVAVFLGLWGCLSLFKLIVSVVVSVTRVDHYCIFYSGKNSSPTNQMTTMRTQLMLLLSGKPRKTWVTINSSLQMTMLCLTT